MKHLLFIFIGLFTLCTVAQVSTPQASTAAKTEQIVGLTSIELSYARPAVKGRTIFGDLIPFGTMWRTGANANTTISFSDPVVVEGNAVEAGKYAIYSMPNKGKWTLYLYRSTDNWGLPKEWNEEHIAAEFDVKANKSNTHVENFTLHLKDITSDKAKLQIAWEKTNVEFTIEVPTDQKVMESINTTLKAEPTANDYYSAAVYYYTEGKDINRALRWIDTAMKMKDEKPFWMLRQQSLIYYKAGKKAEAIQVAEASLEAAKEAGNRDYVKMNEDSLKEWK